MTAHRTRTADRTPHESLRGGAISRSSSRPMYEQLERRITEEIAAGALRPGDLLPGELRLCERFGVSRTVVRQCLGRLEHDGLIVRIKGKGTFVAPPKREETLAGRLTGLYEEASAAGARVTSRVLRHEEVPAPAGIADSLGIEPGEAVILLERLRRVDGELWSLSTTHLPLHIGALIYGADLEQGSLYAALEARGVRAAAGTRTVEAAVTDEREGSLLGLGPGRPVLRLVSSTVDADGAPVEHFSALHRGDRSRFVFDLAPGRGAGRILHLDRRSNLS